MDKKLSDAVQKLIYLNLMYYLLLPLGEIKMCIIIDAKIIIKTSSHLMS